MILGIPEDFSRANLPKFINKAKHVFYFSGVLVESKGRNYT